MCSVIVDDLAHELVALELAVLHLRELELPLAVSSGEKSSGTPRPCSSVISENALAVGTSSLPSR